MTLSFSEIKRRLDERQPERVNEPTAWEAAVATVLVPARDGFDLLLIKRAERTGDPWSGQMGLPGGRRDAADPDLLTTACREAREELGIALTDESLLGELDDLFPNISALPQVVVRPFVFGLPQRPEITPNHEVAGFLWASLDTLRASEDSVEVQVRGASRTVEAFVMGEHVVWGMTNRILAPFLELVRGRGR